MLGERGARSFGIALFFILSSSCKKTEPVQQVAPTETGLIVVASSAPSASASTIASVEIAPEPIASAAPSIDVGGVIGHQAGYAPERFMIGRPMKTPAVRMGTITVNGRLPMEVVRRVARQGLGRFRACYEEGLRRNPSLQGRVTTKYVIGRDGNVVVAQDGGSDLPDANVVQCIIQTFKTLNYPKPELGIATVAVPITFSPEGD
jgi:hypothetical protein